jgi:hypothetical protein
MDTSITPKYKFYKKDKPIIAEIDRTPVTQKLSNDLREVYGFVAPRIVLSGLVRTNTKKNSNSPTPKEKIMPYLQVGYDQFVKNVNEQNETEKQVLLSYQGKFPERSNFHTKRPKTSGLDTFSQITTNTDMIFFDMDKSNSIKKRPSTTGSCRYINVKFTCRSNSCNKTFTDHYNLLIHEQQQHQQDPSFTNKFRGNVKIPNISKTKTR